MENVGIIGHLLGTKGKRERGRPRKRYFDLKRKFNVIKPDVTKIYEKETSGGKKKI